ncbi:MAG: hypothetical protein H8E94_07725, partial [Alphaproteobacteria bacterium]|nr:hypothetical protein [Alphaproteobacteria bacterium]
AENWEMNFGGLHHVSSGKHKKMVSSYSFTPSPHKHHSCRKLAEEQEIMGGDWNNSIRIGIYITDDMGGTSGHFFVSFRQA